MFCLEVRLSINLLEKKLTNFQPSGKGLDVDWESAENGFYAVCEEHIEWESCRFKKWPLSRK